MLLVTGIYTLFSFSEALLFYLIKTGSLTNECGTSVHPTQSSDGSLFGSMILDFCRYLEMQTFWSMADTDVCIYLFYLIAENIKSLCMKITNDYAQSYCNGRCRYTLFFKIEIDLIVFHSLSQQFASFVYN